MNSVAFGKVLLTGFVIHLVFFIADLLWLNSLPWLNVSYGPTNVALVGFTFLRGLFYLLWIFILALSSARVSWAVPAASYWILGIANLLLLLLFLYGAFIEPFQLSVSQFSVPVPGLVRPFRMVQLSDLHVERITSRERSLVQLLAEIKPDMIVVTGDLINESYIYDEQANRAVREWVNQLNAPLGIFVVNGNVDSPLRQHKMLDGLPAVQILNNQVVRIPEISPDFAIIGLDYSNWESNRDTLRRLMAETHPADFTLLLYHKPDLAYAAGEARVSLYLAGHTHGGQVRLPFYGAIYSNSRYGKTFEMGRYQVDQTLLFVSRGVGFTGGDAPRIRFLAPPELVVIDLVPQR